MILTSDYILNIFYSRAVSFVTRFTSHIAAIDRSFLLSWSVAILFGLLRVEFVPLVAAHAVSAPNNLTPNEEGSHSVPDNPLLIWPVLMLLSVLTSFGLGVRRPYRCDSGAHTQWWTLITVMCKGGMGWEWSESKT